MNRVLFFCSEPVAQLSADSFARSTFEAKSQRNRTGQTPTTDTSTTPASLEPVATEDVARRCRWRQ